MRRRFVCPFALAAALALSVAACGGSDSKATNTVAVPTKAAATATSAISIGGATGSPASSGGGGGAVGTKTASPTGSQVAAGPTATRKPDTIIATPRKIATKIPTPAPNPTATTANEPTATTDPSGVQLLLGQDFSSDAAPFYEGTNDSGITMGLADGAYAIQLPANYWQISVTDDSAAPVDGVAVADVTLAPNAYAGLVGRDLSADDGSYVVYICWMGSDGSAGCSLNQSNEWTTLFSLDPGTVAVQDVNTLTMSVVGGDITFAIGDTIVGSASDATATTGYWGLYAESPADAEATLVFDNVAVYQVPPDFQLGQ
jgi:hypothetical protein